MRKLFLLLIIIIVTILLGKVIWHMTGTPVINRGKSQISSNLSIGGDILLTDQNGNKTKAGQFKGKYQLVYFGYSFCPDICPTDLMKMTDIMQSLGASADEVAPIFITVDPERDTIEHMANFIKNFDSRILALTGSKEEVAAAAALFKAYYRKVQNKNSEPADTNYLVDHSAFMYLMGRDGKYLTHFRHSATAADVAKAINIKLAHDLQQK